MQVMLLLLLLFNVDNDARFSVVDVIVDDVPRPHLCLWRQRLRRQRLQVYRINVISPTFLVRNDCLNLDLSGARFAPSPAADAVSRIPRPSRHETAKRLVEGGLECVVGERVEERVDGAVGVAEDGEKLEQVDLVGVKTRRNAEHDVNLYKPHNTPHVSRSSLSTAYMLTQIFKYSYASIRVSIDCLNYVRF